MSGEHAAPVSWWQQWNEAEPVRLYLWGIASAVTVASVAVGWLTAEAAVAVTGVASAVLMVGGAAAARRVAYAPATVDQLAGLWQQHAADAYAHGVTDGLETGRGYSETEVAAATAELRAQPRSPARQCREVVKGYRCELPREHEGPHMMPTG